MTGGALATTAVALAAAPCGEFCSASDRYHRLGVAALTIGPSFVAGLVMAAQGHGLGRRERVEREVARE